MSNQTQSLSPENAYDVLVSQVHAPVFFNKLASVYGISPNSQEDARELIMIASRLRAAHEQELQKQASEGNGFLAEARNDLDATLKQSGYTGLPNSNLNTRKEAEMAITNPTIKEAALVFQSYMANAIQNGSN